ncbi:uncharacterized protein LOC143902568 [Temnothorax americanus]|uniref:uncharacterized protein LOC143902568 n=1 Tax=Temnothorax americanus TaxID=1964332 RepID=UPI0040685EEB
MPRLVIRSAVWILTLLFRLVVTENKTCPSEQNVLLLDSQEDRLTHGSSGSIWRQRPSRGNESIETVGSGSFPNTISRLRVSGNIDLEEGYKNTSANRRTLMDYNGPVIMEDPDDTSDRNLASHVRVKRNEPIVRRSSRSVKLVDSFPRNSQLRTDAASIFGDSMFEGSLSDRENRSDSPAVVDTVVSRSRRKRGVLSKSGYRKKRVKGNVGHAKQHVEMKNGKKKNGVSKSSHQSRKKKTKDLSSREKNKNKGIRTPVRTTDESRIEKRESGNSDLNTDIDTASVEEAGGLISQRENALLTNNRSLAKQREENTVVLPFVHTGRAELRFRIEKLPVNESSFISPNRWTDCPVGTSPCSITSPKYNASDELPDLDVTNLELGPNFDSVAGRKTNNLTVEITPKKPDRGSNASVPETSDPDEITSFYNTESHPVRSNVPGIEDDRNTENGNYDRTNEMSAGSSDEKSRAKRNQEIMSKRYLRSDKNAKGSRRLKDAEQGTVIGNGKRGKTGDRRTRGNRAVRSIEEIKNLAEKLIVKINELQVYVINRTETLRVRDSCKDAVCAVDEEEPRTSLEKKDVSSSTSKIAKNVDGRQRFAKEAALAGKRISQTRSGGSRFARGEYRTSRRSRRKWGRWMDWSSCSVTCGKGRQIRWRHCLHDCNDAETEMEEKTCQLPACPPSKFLGIF